MSVLGGELAGHKGFGLSLAAALVGGMAMIEDLEPTTAGTMQQQGGDWENRLAGVFLAGIDPGAFGDAPEYRRHVAAVLEALNAAPPVPGVERVLVPGDPERANRETRRREGIPIPPAIWEGLSAVAARFAELIAAIVPAEEVDSLGHIIGMGHTFDVSHPVEEPAPPCVGDAAFDQ